VGRVVAGDTTCMYDFMPEAVYTLCYVIYIYIFILQNYVFGFEISNPRRSDFFVFIFVVSLMKATYLSRNM